MSQEPIAAAAALPAKTEVVDRIDQAWQELQAAIGAAPEDALTRPGEDGWSVKDHLAHLAAWERSLLALLRGEDRAAALGADPGSYRTVGIDALNAGIHQRAQTIPLADVLAEFRLGHERLLTTLDSLTDADLRRPYAAYQPHDPEAPSAPVVGWVAGNTYEHYREHVGTIRALIDAG